MTELYAANEWIQVTRLEIYDERYQVMMTYVDDGWCQENRAVEARLWGAENVSETQWWQMESNLCELR